MYGDGRPTGHEKPREVITKLVKFRHVGTRASGPKCLTRVPKDEKCELYEQ
jgi:hypothetical protein